MTQALARAEGEAGHDAEAPPDDAAAADLALSPTMAAFEAPRAPAGEWLAAEPPERDDEGAPPLASESTQVTDEPEAIHTDPGLDVPYEGELAEEATRPALALPEVDPEDGEPSLPPPGLEDFVPVATVIVDPATLETPAQVYTMDLESGHVSMQGLPADAGEVRPRRSPVLWIALGLVAAVLIVAGGAAVGVLIMRPSAPVAVPSTATRGPEGAPAGDPASPSGAPVEPVPTAATEPTGNVAPAVAAEPAEAAPAGEDDGADEADDEADTDDAEELAPAAAGEAAPIAAIEAYRLTLPRLSPRARRVPVAERRRLAGRLRARAGLAYREQRWAEASRLYAEALTHNDWDVAAIEGMARSRAREGQFPEAIAWAELAVTRNARSAATFRILGDVWRQAGHDDRALAAWRRGLRRHPDDRWLRLRIRELGAE
ncbi:MAG: tetratricopeptide repeat protein [Sandaracinaceae bacterium]|nr:tetratricopeptide repeat protein [Sandaracinaceae bacterium]